MQPGISGYRGPFGSYLIPTAERSYPHGLARNKKGIECELRMGGYVTFKIFD